MIVYSEVFEVKYRTSISNYTLPYQKNPNLDYKFIAQKCKDIVQRLDFDGKLHIMDSSETKRLIYYFQYIKKNLYLVAATDHLEGLYEDQCTEQF